MYIVRHQLVAITSGLRVLVAIDNLPSRIFARAATYYPKELPANSELPLPVPVMARDEYVYMSGCVPGMNVAGL